MKYIDTDQIRAEINKRYAEYRAKMKTDDFTYYEGMADALDLFEKFLDTLPEQPLLEDTTIFMKGVAEGRRLEREEQRPELVQHPANSYMYNADAGRGEQLKQAILALLKSDLIQVAGRRFTKTELIEWVETRPAEIKEDEK